MIRTGFSSTFVYVVNGDPCSLSVIRSADDTVISRLEVGGPISSPIVAVDGTKVYLGVYNRGVVVIGIPDNTIRTTIKTTAGIGDCPEYLGITPDGARVYVVDTKPSRIPGIGYRLGDSDL